MGEPRGVTGGASAAAQGLVPARSQFMDSMQLDPETVDNLEMYSHIPPVLMEKCAALSVRPDTVKNLVQSMQGEGTGGIRDTDPCPGCGSVSGNGFPTHKFSAFMNFYPRITLPGGCSRHVILPHALFCLLALQGCSRGPGGLVVGIRDLFQLLPSSLSPSQSSLGSSPTWRPP